jgi:predicted  nucleic acid-binding Zn-ribbon protein
MPHRSTTNVGRVKASPQTQLALLDLADLDAELSRLAHRRESLPEIAEIARLEARARELKDAIVVADTALSDLEREQTRAERDVDQVRTRINRDQARLDAGQVSAAKELASLQSEIESLNKRQADLEDVVLELMERQEGLEASRNGLAADLAGVASSQASATQTRDTVFAEIDGAAETAGAKRAEVSADISADLLALYDKIRTTSGVGAAMLRRGRCEGCHLSLNMVDINAIKATPPDEVVRCEECRRILIRTPESGL